MPESCNHPLDAFSAQEHRCLMCGRSFPNRGPRAQRQDSLHDQMRTVKQLAVAAGCYDAHDWLLRNYGAYLRRAT